MNNKKIFITGITGFVGSHFADYLLKETNLEIYGLTRWRSPKDNILHLLDNERVIFEYGDLTDFSSIYKIIEKIRPELVCHLASQSFVPYSFDAPSVTLEINVVGTCNLLESIKLLKIRDNYDPIIHIVSSSEVYGQVEEKDVPIKEDCPLKPASPYAVSKVGEDMLAYQYWISYGLKTIRTRMFSHTGERRGDVFVVSSFAKQIAKIEAGHQEPIIKVGNLNSVRTFADVKDTVKAYWLLLNKCQPGEVYNIGGKTTMTVREMLDKLLSLSRNKRIKIEVDPNLFRPSDVTLQIPCSDKFKKETGWEPEIPFEDTLKNVLNYWRKKIYWEKNRWM